MDSRVEVYSRLSSPREGAWWVVPLHFGSMIRAMPCRLQVCEGKVVRWFELYATVERILSMGCVSKESA